MFWKKNKADILKKQFQFVADALLLADQVAVSPADVDKMVQSALGGALRTLDPHSRYVSAEEMEEDKNSAAGEFGGLGIEGLVEENSLTVKNILADSPAATQSLPGG